MEEIEQLIKECKEKVQNSKSLSLCWKAFLIVFTLLAVYRLGEACGEFYYYVTR